MITATYHYLACTGKVANQLFPRCQAVSAGSFDEQEVVTLATAEGWVIGTKPLCPIHASAAAPSEDGTTPRRRRRKPAQRPTPDTPTTPEQS